jgi:hypothetical protein
MFLTNISQSLLTACGHGETARQGMPGKFGGWEHDRQIGRWAIMAGSSFTSRCNPPDPMTADFKFA